MNKERPDEEIENNELPTVVVPRESLERIARLLGNIAGHPEGDKNGLNDVLGRLKKDVEGLYMEK